MSDPSEDIEALLDRGLEHFGEGHETQAIALWREVLRRCPGEPRATDYMRSAGVEPDSAGPGAEVIQLHRSRPTPGSLAYMTAAIRAVRQRDYEQALKLLQETRRRNPADTSVSRSIRHVKDRMLTATLRRIGGVDRVPSPAELDSPTTVDAATVSRLVDGVATIEDIMEVSPLGRLATLRELALLLPPKTVAGPVAQTESIAAASKPEPRAAAEPTVVEAAVDYDVQFREATIAYLSGDYLAALAGFEVCAAARPDDTRVEHNLARLRDRLGV